MTRYGDFEDDFGDVTERPGVERRWPSVEEFRRMTAAEVNAFFESIGVDWRVADFDGSLAALRAATPAPPEPDIDVERLARALDNLYESRWGRMSKGQTTVNLEHADAIADEYDRLLQTNGGTE